jgi:hypothetical protein
MESNNTCVRVETGRRIAPAPATRALAFAIDGSRDPNADAERYTVLSILVCSI